MSILPNAAPYCNGAAESHNGHAAPRGGGWVQYPQKVARDNRLSLGARVLYAIIQSYRSDDRGCFTSIARLAQDLGCSRSGAKRFVTELREAGLVVVEERSGGTNTYRTIAPLADQEPKLRIVRTDSAGAQDKQGAGSPVNRGVVHPWTGGQSTHEPGGSPPVNPNQESIEQDEITKSDDDPPLPETAKPAHQLIAAGMEERAAARFAQDDPGLVQAVLQALEHHRRRGSRPIVNSGGWLRQALTNPGAYGVHRERDGWRFVPSGGFTGDHQDIAPAGVLPKGSPDAAACLRIYRHYMQGRAKKEKPQVIIECFDELLRLGLPKQRIIGELERKDRDRAEDFWKLKDRLDKMLPKRGQGSAGGNVEDVRRRARETREQLAAELGYDPWAGDQAQPAAKLCQAGCDA